MHDYQSGHPSFLNGHPLKNIILAIAMMLFLAFSFKLAGDLSVDNQTAVLSQTDTVLSTLNQPPVPTVHPIE